LKICVALYVTFSSMTIVTAIVSYFATPQTLLKLTMNVLVVFPNMLINIIFVKYNFYAQVVNFELNIVKKMLEDGFAESSQAKSFTSSSEGGIICVQEKHPQHANKLFAIRKIVYCVKDMITQVNSSMGLVVFLILAMSIVSLIRNVYDLVMLITGQFSSENGGRKKLFSGER
jgi:7tm Chemosensory receptor